LRFRLSVIILGLINNLNLSKSKVPVKGFMQKNVATISSDSSIKEAAKIMYEKKIGSLVIDDDGELRGIVTERDITRSLFVYDIPSDSKVKDVYSTPLVFLDPDSSILDAADMISKTQILRIPVIKDGKLLGIISATDLAVLFSMFENEELEKKLGPCVSEL
jgi:CBS domain-containing protein